MHPALETGWSATIQPPTWKIGVPHEAVVVPILPGRADRSEGGYRRFLALGLKSAMKQVKKDLIYRRY